MERCSATFGLHSCMGCWIFKESKFYEKPPVQVSEGVLKMLQEAKE